MARLFHLVREEDVSGVSGTGLVAEGVEFSDGRVALRWRGAYASTVVHDSLANVLRIHGHQGRTRVAWVAAPPPPDPADPPEDPVAFAVLSPREREVARALLDGLDNKAIAWRLFISPQTVKNHVTAVYCKLGVQSRYQFVRLLLAPPARAEGA